MCTENLFKHLYEKAKQSKVGNHITCPTCRKTHKKTSYQKVFCSNKGKSNCKDHYWNVVDEDRMERAKDIVAQKRGFADAEEMEDILSMDDGGWDEGGMVEIAICEFCGYRTDSRMCRCD